MALKSRVENESAGIDIPVSMMESLPLWQLDVVELTGHNLEARGREEVNRLLHSGWHLLHIYTLKYEENGVWRERPMAILGKLREEAKEFRSVSDDSTIFTNTSEGSL